MDEHKTESLSRTYVPNEYIVYLSADDRERLEGVEESLKDELSAYLLEHARRERLALLSRPQIEFRTDERLTLGEFGIQTRLVRPPEESPPSAPEEQQPSHGNTMIYSTAGPDPRGGRAGAGRASHARAARRRGPAPRHPAGRGAHRPQPRMRRRAGRRERLAPPCGDPAGAAGTWMISDLGSTNGVLVNGHRIGGAELLQPGDRIALGTADIGFEVE